MKHKGEIFSDDIITAHSITIHQLLSSTDNTEQIEIQQYSTSTIF